MVSLAFFLLCVCMLVVVTVVVWGEGLSELASLSSNSWGQLLLLPQPPE